jgi:hypothetical protein
MSEQEELTKPPAENSLANMDTQELRTILDGVGQIKDNTRLAELSTEASALAESLRQKMVTLKGIETECDTRLHVVKNFDNAGDS